MVRVGGQKTVVATFRHGTFRNLDPRLHTHCVIANIRRPDIALFSRAACGLNYRLN